MNEHITNLTAELKKVENLMAHILIHDSSTLTKAQYDYIHELYYNTREIGHSLKASNK